MSQQHGTAPGYPPSSAGEGLYSDRPPASSAYAAGASTTMAPPSEPTSSTLDSPPGPGLTLPPLRQNSDNLANESERRITRTLGVHSILNPQPIETVERRTRRRSAAQLDSPSTEGSVGMPISMLTGAGAESENLSPTDPQAPRGGGSRRILTPRSPTMQHRATSMTRLQPATGTIDAQQSPFLSQDPRIHTGDPSIPGMPPLPTPPTVQRAGYNFPQTAPPQPGLRNRAASTGMAQSASASPSTSYSSYSQLGQTSPVAQFIPGPVSAPQGSYVLAPGAGVGGFTPTAMEGERGYGIPVTTTNQSSYQILTMETQLGPVQVPVDVQAASRVADEKRKRNAGASARFRARRKEKEAQATNTISRLEQQLRDANDDVEFYRRERDTLANLLYQTPGGDRHFPRPPSPRRRRLSGPSSSSTGAPSTSASGSGAYSGYSDRGERGETGRNTRRRTTSYSLAPSTPASAAPAQPAYAPSALPPIVPAPPAQSQPGFESRGPLRPTSSAPPRSSAPESYPLGAYERSWGAGPGGMEQRPT